MIIAIRLILTAMLIFAIWGETGIFTALGFSLIAISMEFTTFMLKGIDDVLKGGPYDN